MIDFEQARKAMVDNQLRTSAITDRRLLGAMGSVPRERFVPATRQSLAYIDEQHVYPGPLGRALAPAAPFARLVQLAAISEADTVLDVGCTTGYSSTVLAALAARVVALEAEPALADAARYRDRRGGRGTGVPAQHGWLAADPLFPARSLR